MTLSLIEKRMLCSKKQCGMVALFMVTHLSEQGIPARIVNCFTTDA